ncbi:LemA family protein [Xenophilus sp. Marseille-Q4582]|uniref:LemA family protein n=1 Tax=Xenophilus sp. Marseille-Q4582 TaxID=2866600 RepID=UPI001CE47FC0|nr:LemA family protein [Xenophilus sp. Marseille-Q4582]
MKTWIESLLLWGAAAVLLFWFVGAHNRLVRLRSAAVQSYGALDALVVRQIDYVQAQVAQQEQGQASSGDEGRGSAADLTSLQAANAQLLAVLGGTRQHPLDPPAMAALGTALHVMLDAWARLHPESVIAFAADGTLSRPAPLQPAGHAPDPVAEPAPLGWPEPTALIEIARAQFNQAVAQYNTAITQFPAVLLAWVFRWRAAAPLR